MRLEQKAKGSLERQKIMDEAEKSHKELQALAALLSSPQASPQPRPGAKIDVHNNTK